MRPRQLPAVSPSRAFLSSLWGAEDKHEWGGPFRTHEGFPGHVCETGSRHLVPAREPRARWGAPARGLAPASGDVRDGRLPPDCFPSLNLDPSDETYARGLAHRAECETQGKGNSRRAPSHCGCRAWAAWKRAVHQSRRAGYQRHSTKTDTRFLHYSRRETKLSAKGRAGV